MSRKAHLPVEIKLDAPGPSSVEYWKRIDWCAAHIGKQMGSDDLDPPGQWFHFSHYNEDKHIFCFANEEIASQFAMIFKMGFSE